MMMLLTEAAKQLDMPYRTLYWHAKTGRFDLDKSGCHYFVSPEKLEEMRKYFEERRQRVLV